jgi:hypothetical protein
VILTLVPVATGCGGEEDAEDNCDGAGAESTANSGHSHTVCVASSDLMNPPASGASYTTSSADGHTHVVELSSEQLMGIAGGSNVTVTTSVTDAHSHTFTLSTSSGSGSSTGGGY